MRKLLRIVPILLLCASFAAAQDHDRDNRATNNQQYSRQVERPMLEFADANQAKIAWTSKHGEDLDLHYSTDPNNMNQAAVDAIEHRGGDNHRATISNLQPHTTYYVVVTDKRGQPLGPVFSFRTPGRHEQPIHEQPLSEGYRR